MSTRTVTTIPGSASGSTIKLPFPDLAVPEKGAWTLDVTLKSSTSDPTEAKVELIQEGGLNGRVILGTTNVTLTSTPTVYAVPLSAPTESIGCDSSSFFGALSSPSATPNDSVAGTCHLSELFLEVTELTCVADQPCCEHVPDVLHYELTGGCGGESGLFEKLEGLDPNVWYKTGWGGGELKCVGYGCYKLTFGMSGSYNCSEAVIAIRDIDPVTSSCDPLNLTFRFSDSMGGSLDLVITE